MSLLSQKKQRNKQGKKNKPIKKQRRYFLKTSPESKLKLRFVHLLNQREAGYTALDSILKAAEQY